MKPELEQRAQRIRAWDAAAATCAVMAMGVMTISSTLYGLLPVILASAALRFRIPAGRMLELGLSLAAFATGWVLAGYAGARFSGGVLAPVAAPLQMSLLFVMVLRLFLRAPLGDLSGTLVLGMLAFAAAGSASPGWGYPALITVFLVTGLHGLQARQHARAPRGFPPLVELVPGAAYLLLTTIIAFGLGASLPPLYSYASERVVSWITLKPPRTGFTEGAMFLGSMEGMWESDQVVMRLQGDAFGAHLRGSVHRTYSRGRWDEETVVAAAGGVRFGPPADGVGESPVRVFRYGVDAGPLFLPLGASPVGEFPDGLQVDAFGVVRSVSASPPVRYAYRAAHDERLLALGPGPEDRVVPAEIAGPLREMADRWTRRAPTRAQKAVALVHQLETGFVYSQHYQRKPGRDPVLEFLQNDRQGHCEYFASALALLARSLDIPARIVRGYRVHERNPVLGHFVVRESAAHAWAELFVDGAWRTYDPAPLRSAEPAPAETMGTLGALIDVLRYAAGELGHWLGERLGVLLRGALVLATLVFVGFQVRALVRGRRLRGRRTAGQVAQDAGPLPCLEDLMDHLAGQGVTRRPGETLERLAERLPQSMPGDQARHVGVLLMQYAALRYGGHGSDADLARRIQIVFPSQ